MWDWSTSQSRQSLRRCLDRFFGIFLRTKHGFCTDEPLECVLVRSDNEAVVVNPDIEEVEKPKTSPGSIRSTKVEFVPPAFGHRFRHNRSPFDGIEAASDRCGPPMLTLKPTTAVQGPRLAGGSPGSQQRSGPLAMRWAKLILYLYIAQAAVGAAIGFVLPFL